MALWSEEKDILKQCDTLGMQEYTQDLYTLIKAYEKTDMSKCRVVVAGQYNSGKSSLLNALCDCTDNKSIFKTADIVTTRENQEHSHRDIIFVDTPGYGNIAEEREEAYIAWQGASIILFVHSALNGSVSAEEYMELEALYDTIPDFAQRVVFVLSKCGQLSTDSQGQGLEQIMQNIAKDLQEKVMSLEIICVDSVDHIDGLRENEPSLCEASGIQKVWHWIDAHKAQPSRAESNIITHFDVCKNALERRSNELKQQVGEIESKQIQILNSCAQVLKNVLSHIVQMAKEVVKYQKKVNKYS